MITFERLCLDSKYYFQSKELYEKSFPKNERGNFEKLLKHPDNSDALVFIEDGAYVGFVILFVVNDLAHIVYLAICDEKRNHGYGSKILQLLDKEYADYRIFADVEKVEENVKNYDQRVRRQAFYKKNGYYPSGIEYNWHGDDYQILLNRGSLTEKEFDSLWIYLDKKYGTELREF